MTALPAARFPDLDIYGDGNESSPGTLPISWLVSINAWGTLFLVLMAIIYYFVVKKHFDK